MPAKPWDQMSAAEKVEDLNRRHIELIDHVNAETGRLSREIDRLKGRLHNVEGERDRKGDAQTDAKS